MNLKKASLVIAGALVAFAADVYACSSAVIAGKITPDGRPLLWKQRDTGAEQNSVKYYKGGKHSFIGIVNSKAKNPTEVWMGTNDAGFSIMNTQSYNLVPPKGDEDMGPANGNVMRHALEICSSVADFKHFLDTLSRRARQRLLRCRRCPLQYQRQHLRQVNKDGGNDLFDLRFRPV